MGSPSNEGKVRLEFDKNFSILFIKTFSGEFVFTLKCNILINYTMIVILNFYAENMCLVTKTGKIPFVSQAQKSILQQSSTLTLTV